MVTVASLRPGISTMSVTSSTPSPNRRALQRSGVSWTDDLPVCELSDVGIAPNIVYLENGKSMEAHQYADYAFNFRSENGCYLYGLFDGHEGVNAANFASSRLPAELLLGQINPNFSPPDPSIRKVLYQAFSIVERGFFESIDAALAKKTYLQSQVDERAMNQVTAKQYPIYERLKKLDTEIKGGTTAVVALIINNKLFVANVGECRALLCRLHTKTTLEVQQLSVDHNLYQAQEIARLRKLGLNVEVLQNRGKLGVNECTRCIGDYTVKGGYKENDHLKDSLSEPSIAEPSITEGIIIDEYPNSFLILMSDDLYKSVQQCVRNIDPNDYVAQLTSRELMIRRSIEGVGQTVVEKIAHMHRQLFGNQPMTCRGDMTLIVRNFTHPVGTGNGLSFIGVDEYPVSIPYEGIPTCERSNMRLVMPSSAVYTTPHSKVGSHSSGTPSDDTPTNLGGATSGMESGVGTSQSRTSSRAQSLLLEDEKDNFTAEEFFRCDVGESSEIPVDSDGRVQPYISFDTFHDTFLKPNTNNIRTTRVAWGPKR